MDGESTDETPAIIATIAAKHQNIRTIPNPLRYQGNAVNIAVRAIRADYYLWLGAHTHFPNDYLRRCIETAVRTNAEVVGGICITRPGDTGYGAQVVQALTTHRFGVGNSTFRLGAREGPVDTVAYALFARRVFDAVGFLDERLIRAQDYEYNQRIRRAGMTIWLDPKITCSYHNQSSLMAFYWKQVALDAPYNAYLWYVAPYSFTIRHAVTPVFALGVVGGACLYDVTRAVSILYTGTVVLYGSLAIAAAGQQAVRHKKILHLFCLPICFFAYHFLHGLGVLYGLAKLATKTAPVQTWRAHCSKSGD